MSGSIALECLAWDHSRAYPPVVAAAQRYEELHPGVRISWRKHSLHEFGHAAIDTLSRKFDLVIMDHPWLGFASARNCLLGLTGRVAPAMIRDLDEDSVGASFRSYHWERELWALPLDAACPTAFWREDRVGGTVPQTWEELIHWTDAGRVIAPGFGPDLVLHLLGLCATEDDSTGADPDRFASDAIAPAALEHLRALFSRLPPEVFKLNPIAVHELLAKADGDGPDYCPFAYAYNNYGRQGFGAHPLAFGNSPRAPSGHSLRTVLGGTGIAVSAHTTVPEVAVDFAVFLASKTVQQTLYTHAGGQPARLSAWLDPLNNELTGGFFRNSLPSIQHAWVRPRFDGYTRFQEQAGPIIQDWIQAGGSVLACLDSLNALWRRVQPSPPS